jgi:Zn-dependent membrane protease YugP
MAAQKSSLAVLDKEGDKDMKTRIVLTPLIYFGPLAFVPLVAIGVAVDIIFFHTIGLWSILLSLLGLLFYVISFIMSIVVLKTEKKAQEKAIEVMRRDNLATEEEIGMCKELFRLYNIEYINDMVIALLELIYRVLLLFANMSSSSSSSRD